MPTKRLIIGCGYLGSRVAERWARAGDEVYALTRSEQRATRLRESGLRPIVGDVTRPDTLHDLPQAQTLLYAVGYDRSASESTIGEVYEGGMRNVLAAIGARAERVIYVSTTGVYGPAEGEWVDESTAPDPQRDGGVASLAAERLLATSPLAERGVALRLAGIYGPDRLPYLETLQQGEPIAAPRRGWLNLIHVDDAVATVVAAAKAPAPPRVLCVSDGAPVERRVFYEEAARLLGAPQPRFIDPPPGSSRAARAAANKRVSNRLMLESLGVELRFPTYIEGLTAIFSALK